VQRRGVGACYDEATGPGWSPVGSVTWVSVGCLGRKREGGKGAQARSLFGGVVVTSWRLVGRRLGVSMRGEEEQDPGRFAILGASQCLQQIETKTTL
jgi:hypothetical protein